MSQSLVISAGRIAFVGDEAPARELFPDAVDTGSGTERHCCPGLLTPTAIFRQHLTLPTGSTLARRPWARAPTLQRFCKPWTLPGQPRHRPRRVAHRLRLRPGSPCRKPAHHSQRPGRPVPRRPGDAGACFQPRRRPELGRPEVGRHRRRTTPTPGGGVIARLPGSQEPAGLLMETAYLNLVAAKLPVLRPARQAGACSTPPSRTMPRRATPTPRTASSPWPIWTCTSQAAAAGAAVPGHRSPGLLHGGAPMAGQPRVPCRKLPQRFQDCRPENSSGRFTPGPHGLHARSVPDGRLGRPGGLARGTDHAVQSLRGDRSQHPQPRRPAVRPRQRRCRDRPAHPRRGTDAEPRHADDRRTVAIHSQFQHPDQLADYVRLGITPSYFTNHTFFWGDVHRANAGEQRACLHQPPEVRAGDGAWPCPTTATSR